MHNATARQFGREVPSGQQQQQEGPPSTPGDGSELWIKTMDADEADDLADLFNIRIEDLLLAPGPFTFQYPDVADDLQLFAPQAQHQIQPLDLSLAALHLGTPVDQQPEQHSQPFLQYQHQQQQQQQQHQFQPHHQHQHHQRYYSMPHSQSSASSTIFSGGGPQRSISLSPVITSVPYPSTQTHCQTHPFMSSSAPSSSSPYPGQIYHYASNHSLSFEQQQQQQQHQLFSEISRMSTMSASPRIIGSYAASSSSSPSPSPQASPAVGSPSTSFLSPMSPMSSMSPMSPLSPARISHFMTEQANLPTTSSTAAAAGFWTTTGVRLPATTSAKGMTVVKNEDGSVMVYNPTTESMIFRCELCPGESFGRIHDLKRHQTSRHLRAMKWSCDFCQRPFARRDALLRHYTVKSGRDDGIHPTANETERLMAARAKAKLIC